MEIKSTKRRLLLYLLGTILLVLCGIIVLYTAIVYMYSEPLDSTIISRSKEFAFILSIVGILFFGIVMIYLINKIFNNKPILIINKDGFTDDSTISALGFVSWCEVKTISLLHIGQLKMIGVDLVDLGSLLINKPWYTKKLIKGNLSMNYPPITINLQSSKESLEEVLAIMNKYWDEWKKNNEQEIK